MISPSFYTSVEKFGNQLLYRGYDESGSKLKKRISYKPVMYVQSKNTSTKYKALDGTPVEPVPFGSMKECKEFIDLYKDVPNFKVYGNDRHVMSFIADYFPGEIKYDKRLIDIASIDIETESHKGFPDPENPIASILTIAVKSRNGKHLWGMKDFETKDGIIYHHYKDEVSMLTNFLEWWSTEENTPDVITGWNVRFFDVPYLVARITSVLSETQAKRLSPWNMLDVETVTILGNKNTSIELKGITILDYMDLFKKFSLNTYGQQESYKLDFIAELVLKEKKVDYSEYPSLQEFYERDFQRFAEYNMQDSVLVDKLEEKLGLISLVFTLAYKGGVNYSDTLGTTTIWDTIIFRNLLSKNIIIPPSNRSSHISFAGGYVKDVMVGMHEWVVSFDVNSLYPNLIVQYNMSPETLVPQSKIQGLTPEGILKSRACPVPNENLAVAANGSCYRRDKKGIVPELVEGLYTERNTIKKEMLAYRQRLEKVKKKLTELEAE